MARGNPSGGGEGLLETLRNSPETKRLTEEARHLFEAGSGRLSGKLGDGVGGVAKKLTNIGESGSLGFTGEGAKRMLSGDGPVKSAVGAAADKAKGLLGKGGKGGGKSKAMNIEETIDIGVPVSVAYDQWTQFQDFSQFMKGVESVDQTDDTELNWRSKVFKSTRTWKAKIQEQVPDRRIVWTSDGAKGTTKGVVTFHPLADDLTRVLLALEYYPSGVVEKTGNLWRAPGRRARLDLKNFRRFVMMENEPTGSWRGEIRDGDVVDGPDEAEDDESQAEDDESRAEDDENQSDEDDEGQAEDDENQSDEDDSEQSQRDEQPRRRRRPAAKSEPEKRTRRSRPAAKKSGGSSSSPRKQPRKSASGQKRASKRAPAKKSSSSSGSSARKQSSSSSGSTARKQSSSSGGSSSSRRSPRKQSSSSSGSKSSSSSTSSSSSSRSPRKQASKRAPAKKQATKRAPAKKSSGSSRSPRKQAGKRTTARKRTSR